jgi:hypothetical protein
VPCRDLLGGTIDPTFVPQTEQECQFATRFQWYNPLRQYTQGFEELRHKDENLLADMIFAIMTACHWALPGARHGDTQTDAVLDSIIDGGDMLQAETKGLKKTDFKAARQKFRAFISRGNHWRSTKMDLCVKLTQDRLHKQGTR